MNQYEFAITRISGAGFGIETKYVYRGFRNPTLVQVNDMIYTLFGIPNRADVFVVADTYHEGRVEQFVIQDGKYA